MEAWHGNKKYEKLKDALLKALEATELAKTDDDDGTCNLDSPVLLYRKMGYQKQKAIAVVNEVGLGAWAPSPGYWNGCLVLTGMTIGQGNCRTAMAEAFRRSLKESGIESGMYYQMD